MIVGTAVNSAIRIDFGEGDKRVYVQAKITGRVLEMNRLDREQFFAFIDDLKQLVERHERAIVEASKR